MDRIAIVSEPTRQKNEDLTFSVGKLVAIYVMAYYVIHLGDLENTFISFNSYLEKNVNCLDFVINKVNRCYILSFFLLRNIICS